MSMIVQCKYEGHQQKKLCNANQIIYYTVTKLDINQSIVYLQYQTQTKKHTKIKLQ